MPSAAANALFQLRILAQPSRQEKCCVKKKLSNVSCSCVEFSTEKKGKSSYWPIDWIQGQSSFNRVPYFTELSCVGL